MVSRNFENICRFGGSKVAVGVWEEILWEIGSVLAPDSRGHRALAPFWRQKAKTKEVFIRVASILMPPPKAESDYSINFDALEKCFLRSLIFFAFSRPTTWRGFQKVFESTHKNRPSYSLLSEGHWKFSPGRLNFSVFPWSTPWGTNFSGDTHKIDPSHSSLSEGIYRKMAITRKLFSKP